MRPATRFVTGWRLVALIAAILLGSVPAGARAESCTELITNGGFETNDAWVLGVSPIMPQYVTYTRHGGSRALALGITSGANIASYSSARQTVTIPAAAAQVTLAFWFYAMADAPATTDYMEVVLLDATGTVILAKPWQSHNDSRLWNQLSFDLNPWRGQTVQVYFNVYNDGVGGAAALFLDDVSLQTCTGAPSPTGTAAATATGAPTVTSAPNPTATPGCVTAVINGGFESGLTSWEAQGDPRGIALSTNAPHSGNTALRLGALDQSINGFTSVRQQVAIPAGFAQVKLEFWTYTFLEAGAGADYQRADLLNTSGTPLTVLWNSATDTRAWERQEVNLAAYAGQTVFLRFGVNNDGGGGRAAMYLDDVWIQACNPGATPASTPTPTGTPAPSVTSTGVAPTYTSAPPGCVDLAHNGDFESGLLPWRRGASTLPAAIVSDPVYEGDYAVRLGAQYENDSTYSSIRQTVTAPWGRPRVLVSFWAYTWAEPLTGSDRQQFAVLGTDDTIWAVPWSVLEDAQVWQQYVFDLVGVAGQTFDLYFNAINDGMGGSTALFVDKVQLWGCTAGAYPPELEGADMAWYGGSEGSGTDGPEYYGADDAGTGIGERERSALATPWGEQTRVAIILPTGTYAGLVLATVTPPATATPASFMSGLLGGLQTQLRQRWLVALAAIAIVVLLFVLLLRAVRP